MTKASKKAVKRRATKKRKAKKPKTATMDVKTLEALARLLEKVGREPNPRRLSSRSDAVDCMEYIFNQRAQVCVGALADVLETTVYEERRTLSHDSPKPTTIKIDEADFVARILGILDSSATDIFW